MVSNEEPADVTARLSHSTVHNIITADKSMDMVFETLISFGRLKRLMARRISLTSGFCSRSESGINMNMILGQLYGNRRRWHTQISALCVTRLPPYCAPLPFRSNIKWSSCFSICVLSKGFGGQAVRSRWYAASKLQLRVRIPFIIVVWCWTTSEWIGRWWIVKDLEAGGCDLYNWEKLRATSVRLGGNKADIWIEL